MAFLINILIHHFRRSYGMRTAFAALSALNLFIILLAPYTARCEPTPEYKVKAAFLFNFAQFVDWPTNSFATAESPLIIGVLGDDPFGKALDNIVTGERVKNRTLLVRRYRNVKDIDRCHILFISPSERGRLVDIFKALGQRPILTVGDTDRFARQGGMIRFLTEKNKIRLRINTEAVRTANLTISSKLLRAAELVTTEKD